MPHYREKKFLLTAISRYAKFLYLKQSYPDTFLVPCYDIDIVWHTHQVQFMVVDVLFMFLSLGPILSISIAFNLPHWQGVSPSFPCVTIKLMLVHELHVLLVTHGGLLQTD